VREASRQGASPSATAFVADAIREKLARMEEERMRALLEQAATDPLFLADVEDVQRDFAGCERPPTRRRPR
jgi:selenophosphate synthase